MDNLRRTTVLVVSVIAGVLFCLADNTRAGIPAITAATVLDGVELRDQDGRAVNARDLRGHILLLNFVYTSCSSTCPVQTHQLVVLQQALAAKKLSKRVVFLSVSVDPMNDGPSELKEYGRRHGVDFSNWRFATGDVRDIDRLVRRLSVLERQAGNLQLDTHNTDLRLMAPDGRFVQRYVGRPVDTDRLVREIELLEKLSGPSRPRGTSAVTTMAVARMT